MTAAAFPKPVKPEEHYPHRSVAEIMAGAADQMAYIRDKVIEAREYDLAEEFWRWADNYDRYRRLETRLFADVGVLLEQARRLGVWSDRSTPL